MGRLSVVINTLNEEENLPRVLSSVKNIADEVVVVDMKSTDNTQHVAKKFGARVYEHKRVGYVEPARNYAIEKAKGEWILILDADEKLSKTLEVRIKNILENPDADFYRLPRKNIIFGKWLKHSRWWPDYNIRLFKKGYVIWSEVIHSVPETRGKGLDIEADETSAIVHHHYETVEQYVQRLNRYTTEHAKLLLKDNYVFEWHDLISKPVNEFLSRYFQGEGYKDGLHGLALSGLQGFSEFVMYLKLWQMDKFKEQDIKARDAIGVMKEKEADFHYWQADTLLKLGGGLTDRVKRKLKLP